MLLVVFAITMLASGLVWLVPLEVFQQWAYDRAGTGEFDRFEAIGGAEYSVWFARTVLPILAIMVWTVWKNGDRWCEATSATWQGLRSITDLRTHPIAGSSPTLIDRIRTISLRGFLLAWMLLFITHGVHGIGERIHEWPYFRLNSGNTVLPNISDSNRAVIRYLQEATPVNARILVASDQKLFFLSYYLRPRVLLHRMHPDSEHVIPLKDQERKLSAYRLDDLSSDDLQQLPHDYTLEYFEHPDFVDRAQLLDDTTWISFIRRKQQSPSFVPPYVVRLRPAGGRR